MDDPYILITDKKISNIQDLLPVLEQIVKEGCDGIAVMNYNRADEYGQMETEVELAEKYGKKVICIYELHGTGKTRSGGYQYLLSGRAG